MAPLKLVKEQEGGAGQAMVDGNKNNRTLKRHVSWRPLHNTLEPILPAVCQKKVFCFFRFSANEKPNFFKRLYELPQLQVAINDYITLP